MGLKMDKKHTCRSCGHEVELKDKKCAGCNQDYPAARWGILGKFFLVVCVVGAAIGTYKWATGDDGVQCETPECAYHKIMDERKAQNSELGTSLVFR